VTPLEHVVLAVLPLANLTGNSAQTHFVDGLHVALVTELAQIASLRVISRQSVLEYEGSDQPLREIAGELGVDALVEGSAFLVADSVRIDVRVIHASPERHVWANSYSGLLRDALALQGDVARGLAGAIRVRVARDESARLTRARSADTAAQRAYLNGVSHLVRRDRLVSHPDVANMIRIATEHLERAVDLDPDWAEAHARLATATLGERAPIRTRPPSSIANRRRQRSGR
jgi:TolB-like protein